MDRRHLRAEDRIRFAHLFSKYNPFKISGLDLAFFRVLFPHADRCQQGADTDTRRAQVIDLVDFQACINLAGFG